MIKIGPTRAMPEELAAQKPMDYCDFCVRRGHEAFDDLGYRVHSLGDFITPVDADFARRFAAVFCRCPGCATWRRCAKPPPLSGN